MAAGGFKMSLGGLKAKPGLKAAANKNSAPKPKKALLGDDEPEDTNGLQEIAGFDAASGGAIDAHAPAEKKGPLVIPSLPNRNWREEARKKQLARAPHTQQAQNGDVVMDEPEKEVVYGLTVPTAPTTDTPSNGAEETADQTAMDIDNAPQDDLTDAQRLEKQALESLLTGKSTDTARVVPAITDEEALANDLADAPDAPDVAAYEATPIEGFGLAMLRGMGWKDSDGEGGGRRKNNGGKAPAEVKRRPALLGIGAKEDAAKDVELGEFNSKARPKKGQRGAGEAPQGYNPVSLRNKKTGEIITEEELKRKMESQEMVQEEAARSERRSDRSDRERSERESRSSRDDKRDRRSDRDSHRDSHRDRDRDRDRRSSRDRGSRRDYDRRDDRRESDRRDPDRRDKRRHRSRSRSRSPRDDKRRERYRSRSRDRDRDDEERRRRRRERERRDRDRDRSRDRD